MQLKIIICLLLLYPSPIKNSYMPSTLYIWNVGQGQWITYSDIDLCIHFDMGGELFPITLVQRRCQQKTNALFFSHWDQDHIGFLKKIRSRLNHLCVVTMPGGLGTKRKQSIFAGLPTCLLNSLPVTEVQFENPHVKFQKLKNFYSRVYILKEKVLIPGDSPIPMEKKWLSNIKKPSAIRYLILGHHGSQTSSSPQLLQHLPNLILAIASSRKERYQHPHPIVIKRLIKYQVPLLTTETWGHLVLEL